MSPITARRCLLGTLAFAMLACVTPARGEVTDRHRDLVQSIFDRLIAVTDQPEEWPIWPPLLNVADSDEINAFASEKQTEEGVVPMITINRGLIERIANFDEDVLAFTVGHELGHVYFSHLKRGRERMEEFGEYGAATAVYAADREDELQADLFGMQVALKAGYSHRGIRKNLLAMAAPENGSYYCHFVGLSSTHPAWEARAVQLQQDAVQEELWRSMVAFRNGVLFLQTENYLHAEFCFRRVIDEFPECYEAWANLGYALLMQYADALEEDDLRSFDIGHLVVGGFYQRPGSLDAKIRGVDEDLWYEAVGAFREALRLKERLNIDDDMLLVQANLAVAHLIHPAGKQVGEAEKYFSAVFKALNEPGGGASLEPLERAALLINAGAGRGMDDALLAQVTEALEVAARKEGKRQVAPLQAALDYTQAKALVNSNSAADQTSAFEMLESYLSTMSRASSYWPLAYEQYQQLANKLGRSAKEMVAFKKPATTDWRRVTSVSLDGDVLLGLAQVCDDVFATLGAPQASVPIIAGTNLKRYHYPSRGLSFLGSREVLALFLESEEAPPITLSRPGLGGDTETLFVGMTRKKLESLIGDEWDVEFASIDDPDTVYHLYRGVGIAAQFDGDTVTELVIVVPPRKA
ncbi:MAG: M48 family metalloprotease [Planctomycetota bacterium]